MKEEDYEKLLIDAIKAYGGTAQHMEVESFPDLLIMRCGDIVLCENKRASLSDNIYSIYQPGQLNYSATAQKYGVSTKTCLFVSSCLIYVFRTSLLANRYIYERRGARESVEEAVRAIGAIRADSIEKAARLVMLGWRTE